jgi:hypothetical protein
MVLCGIQVALLIFEICAKALSEVICGSTPDAESDEGLEWMNF